MSTKFELQQKEFLEFIKLLNDNDLLSEVVVVGSWVEYIYEQSGLLKGFDANLRTLDIDFLVKNLRLPNPPASITRLADGAGYDINHDILYGTTKIVTPNRLEIEFLINQKGSGTQRVMQTNLGVNAQALRHMDITLRNTVTIDFLTMQVTIPKPEAYVIHKIVINHDRKEKQEKDRRAIYRIAPYLDKDVFQEVYEGLFKKEKKTVDAFIQQYGELFQKENSVDELILGAKATAEAHNSTCAGKTSYEEQLSH